MISMELSAVQQKKEKRAELDAAVADFVAHGGTIATLQGFVQQPRRAPKAYGRLALGDRPAPQRRRAPKPVADGEKAERAAKQEALNKARAEQFEQIRELAKTMTITEVVYEVGLSNQRLRAIATELGFEFQKYDPRPNLKPNQVKRENDPANVAGIIAARDRGLSRKAARDELGISDSLMNRLLKEYGVTYPIQRQPR